MDHNPVILAWICSVYLDVRKQKNTNYVKIYQLNVVERGVTKLLGSRLDVHIAMLISTCSKKWKLFTSETNTCKKITMWVQEMVFRAVPRWGWSWTVIPRPAAIGTAHGMVLSKPVAKGTTKEVALLKLMTKGAVQEMAFLKIALQGIAVMVIALKIQRGQRKQ